MSIHFAGSAKTRTVSLLEQIMSPVEWNAEKSKDVIQQYYHWLELISKYEAISSEKISDTVKITLALQNVKGNLAQSLNVSFSDSTTWPQVHAFLINYFNNAVPVELKPIYQFDQTEKTEITTHSRKVKAKVKNQKVKKAKDQRVLIASEFKRETERQRQDQVKRQGSMDHLVMGSKSAECQLGSRSERSKRVKERQGKSACSVCENQDTPQISVGGIEIKKDGILKDLRNSSKEAQVHSTQGGLQYSSVPSGSTNSDLTSRSPQRFSRFTTSSSAIAVSKPKSGFDSMRFNCDCSFESRSSRWIQRPETQHQLSF